MVGNLTGDIYAGNGVTKIVENGTNDLNASFFGRFFGPLEGNVVSSQIDATIINATTVNVAGAILPSYGNSSSSGIKFPNDPGGGGGDTAWMRYYAVSGEKTVLEIGVANDPSGGIQDSLYLNAVGGVGVKTQSPRYALDVNGDIGCNALHGVADNSVLWNGSNKFISTSAPTNDQGVDGDFWFQREA